MCLQEQGLSPTCQAPAGCLRHPAGTPSPAGRQHSSPAYLRNTFCRSFSRSGSHPVLLTVFGSWVTLGTVKPRLRPFCLLVASGPWKPSAGSAVGSLPPRDSPLLCISATRLLWPPPHQTAMTPLLSAGPAVSTPPDTGCDLPSPSPELSGEHVRLAPETLPLTLPTFHPVDRNQRWSLSASFLWKGRL